MSDSPEYPASPFFEGAELDVAVVAGKVCENCIYWAPNSGRGIRNGEMIGGRGQCLGEEANSYSSDHIPWTEPKDSCSDFQSKHKKLWYRISFQDIAAHVEAAGLFQAVEKAMALCGKKEPGYFKWNLPFEQFEKRLDNYSEK